jgi:hypothetical protein
MSFKVWLIEKSRLQIFVIIVVFFLSLLCEEYFDFNEIINFFTSIIYLLLIFWVYFSIFCKVKVTEDSISKEIEKVVEIKKFDEPENFNLEFWILTLIIFLANRSFFIFGVVGVLMSLFIITMTGFLWIFSSVLNLWLEQKKEHYRSQWSFTGGIPKFYYSKLSVWNLPAHKDFISVCFLSIVVGFIYFIPWKNAYCHQFGVSEIGNYFEKDTYTTKYYVNIFQSNSIRDRELAIKLLNQNIDSNKTVLNNMIENKKYEYYHTYTLPAEIMVSNGFTEFNNEKREIDLSNPNLKRARPNLNERKVKILNISFNKSVVLKFDKCFLRIRESNDCNCFDNDSIEWNIELVKKVNL